MTKILLALMVAMATLVVAAQPVQRNTYTTNAPGIIPSGALSTNQGLHGDVRLFSLDTITRPVVTNESGSVVTEFDMVQSGGDGTLQFGWWYGNKNRYNWVGDSNTMAFQTTPSYPSFTTPIQFWNAQSSLSLGRGNAWETNAASTNFFTGVISAPDTNAIPFQVIGNNSTNEFNVSDTWNDTRSHSMLQMFLNNSNSASSSTFIDVLVNGMHAFQVGKNGQVWIGTNLGTMTTIGYLMVDPGKPPTKTTGNGTSALNTGKVTINSGSGGDTSTNSVSASGGNPGSLNLFAGNGGYASSAVGFATGSSGAALNLVGGGGGGGAGVATNGVAGAGGTATLSGGAAGTPSGSTNIKGANGGDVFVTGGASSAGVNTNGGNGGNVYVSPGAGSTGTPAGSNGSIYLVQGTVQIGTSNSPTAQVTIAPESTNQYDIVFQDALRNNKASVDTNGVFTGIIAPPGLTTNTAAAATNWVFAFNSNAVPAYYVIAAAADVNFQQTTGRLAGVWQSLVVKVYAGGSQRNVWLNPSWHCLGSTTNITTLASGKQGILSLAQDGSSETNVAAVWTVEP